MSVGFWQILLVVALIVLLFGRNKISDLMGDVAKGIKSFKKGLADDDAAEPRAIARDPAATTASTETLEQNSNGR